MSRQSFESWQTLRKIAFERDNYTCVYCGAFEGVTLHLDHLYPVSKGGGNDLENLVTACDACNLSKHARIIPDAWIPVAECFGCGVRSHPQGRATMFHAGPLWSCPTCTEKWEADKAAERREGLEEGEWSDLTLEEYGWDLVEYADMPEIVAEKYPHLLRKAA